MRVLMIGSEPRHGLMFHPTRLAIALRSCGCEVTVASLPGRAFSPDLPASLAAAGIPLLESPDLALHGRAALISRNRSLRRIVASERPDVLHCFGPVTAFQAAPPWISGRPRVVAMIEGMGHDLTGLRAQVGSRLGAVMLNCAADSVLSICELERRRLIATGVSRRRLDVVFNPIDCDELLRRAGCAIDSRRLVLTELGLPEDTFLIGCFAHHQVRKRHDLVISAFDSLASRYPNVALVCAGGNSPTASAIAACRRAERTGRLRMLGMLDSAVVYRYINACDCVMHLSNAETFGFSLIEPLVLGKPLVAACVGVGYELEAAGVADIIPPDDGAAATAALARVHRRASSETAEERSARGARAAAFARSQFDVGAVARRLFSLYSRLLRGT